MSEITFNSSLLREFRAIDFVNRLLDEHRLDPTQATAGTASTASTRATALAIHTAASKLDTSWRFFQELHDAGREAAEAWLVEHYDDVGVRGTVDLRHEFM